MMGLKATADPNSSVKKERQKYCPEEEADSEPKGVMSILDQYAHKSSPVETSLRTYKNKVEKEELK